MELLDRDYQRRLLQTLSEFYPEQIPNHVLRELTPSGYETALAYNLAYLEQHGLIEVTWRPFETRQKNPAQARINAKGIDFITDDGGLSAILGVVTVKLHGDTIRELLVAKIEKDITDPTAREQLIKKAKSLPAKAFEKVSLKLIEKGLSNPGQTFEWFTNLLD